MDNTLVFCCLHYISYFRQLETRSKYWRKNTLSIYDNFHMYVNIYNMEIDHCKVTHEKSQVKYYLAFSFITL